MKTVTKSSKFSSWLDLESLSLEILTVCPDTYKGIALPQPKNMPPARRHRMIASCSEEWLHNLYTQDAKTLRLQIMLKQHVID